MKKLIRRQWIEALRSGDYKQGKWALKKTNSEREWCYCCLGVLADMLPSATEVVVPDQNTEDGIVFKFAGHSYLSSTGLPPGFQGLKSEQTSRLMEMNDDGDYNFHDIADWIEQNIKAA